MNILLVENDLFFSKCISKSISSAIDGRIHMTVAPAKIFQWCHQGDIDLILIDINLPGFRWQEFPVSGTTLARMLKEDPQTAGIPIILTSTYAMRSQKATLLEVSKADYFWTKPITRYNELIEKMKQLVEQNSPIQQPALFIPN